ncbi:MAG: SMP-30/gluconolactonase/LRE family protein [Pseudomonadota bacterium]
MPYEIRRIAEVGATLGEGPVWRAEGDALLFTDIIGRALLRWRASDGVSRVPLGFRVGAFAPIAGAQDLLACAEQGLWRLSVDFETGAVGRRSLGLDAAIPAEGLMNDGRPDPAGRFTFGSKALNEVDPIGRMLSFDGAALSTLTDGFVVFNGPAFSPNGDRVYFADSPSKEIRVAPYDPATGRMGAPSLFARLSEDAGYPDGMAVDAEGGLWNAHWDGGRLTRYRPDGSVDRVVATPVTRPTCVAFGGDDLKTLFVTSAKRGRDDAEDATEPGAGDLFALEVEVPGAPVSAARV